MKVKTVPDKPVTAVNTGPRRTPRVAAARHIGTGRPRRAWSLLLAPSLSTDSALGSSVLQRK